MRNRLMAVSAVMRSLMGNPGSLPMPAFRVGETLYGQAVGEVVDTGELVEHRAGRREYAVVDEAGVRPIVPGVLPDPAAYLPQGWFAWLGVRCGGLLPGRNGVSDSANGRAGGGTRRRCRRLHGRGDPFSRLGPVR